MRRGVKIEILRGRRYSSRARSGMQRYAGLNNSQSMRTPMGNRSRTGTELPPLLILLSSDIEDQICIDEAAPIDYDWPEGVKVEHPLPVSLKKEAVAYIEIVVKDLPFNARVYFALPLWYSFVEMWNETGSFNKSMRAI